MNETRGPERSGPALWLLAIRRDRKALVGACLLGAFTLIAVAGPWFVGDPRALVGIPLQPPSWTHPLGTNGQGQDALAQLVVGTRVSLALGFAVGLAVVAIGVLVGIPAGYFGGRTDGVLSVVANVFLVLPGLPLAIVIAAYLPPSPAAVAIVLIVTGWAWNARVVRAQTLALRNRDFVAAAVVSGESDVRILLIEILPNMLSVLVAQVIGSTVYAIGAQVGLEFLGLGDVSRVSWGTILYWAQNDSALLTGAWWMFVPAGLCVALVGFGLTLLNSGFDEITNPRLALERAWRNHLAHRGRAPERSTPVVRDHA
jgi:peptide/nickel transport system permease protein